MGHGGASRPAAVERMPARRALAARAGGGRQLPRTWLDTTGTPASSSWSRAATLRLVVPAQRRARCSSAAQQVRPSCLRAKPSPTCNLAGGRLFPWRKPALPAPHAHARAHILPWRTNVAYQAAGLHVRQREAHVHHAGDGIVPACACA